MPSRTSAFSSASDMGVSIMAICPLSTQSRRYVTTSGASGLDARLRDMDHQELITEPAQGALFQIEGPDEDGCVWACSSEGRDIWCHNLGPKGKVAEVLASWLSSVEEVEEASS